MLALPPLGSQMPAPAAGSVHSPLFLPSDPTSMCAAVLPSVSPSLTSAASQPNDAEEFCRELIREDRELGERVMITRLDLAQKYQAANKKGAMDQEVVTTLGGLNLEIYRARLLETIKIDASAEPSGEPSPPPAAGPESS